MRSLTRSVVYTLTAALAICLSLTSPATAQILLDLPAEPLAQALRSLAIQADLNIYFDALTVQGIRVPALRAKLDVNQALDRLLAGTHLRAVRVDEHTIRIVDDRDRIDPTTSTRRMGGQPTQSPSPHALRHAHEATSAASFTSDPPKAAMPNSPELATVIVTAQHRTQNVQNVPISMSVVTEDEINRRGLVNAADYLRGMPGVTQVATDYNGGESIIIRGIETTPSAQNFSSGPTIATYFGETPTTFTGGLNGGTNIDLKLVDIARVEVLRGPQGTSFGDSSLGGAVRVIPVAPSLSGYTGRVQASYSHTGEYGGSNYDGEAIVNLPIISNTLALRGVGYLYRESGYYRNLAGSDVSFQTGPVSQYGAQAFAHDASDIGSDYVGGGRLSALFVPNDAWRVSLNLVSQNTEQDGVPLSNVGIYQQTLFDVSPDQVRRGQSGGFADSYIQIFNPVVTYHLGWADLLGTYSYTRSGSENAEPYGYLGLNWAQSAWSHGDHSEHVGELRLVGKLRGAWNFLVGLFDENVQDNALFTYSWFGSPATDIVAKGIAGQVGTYNDVRNLKQKAAYAEVYWHFLPGFTLTGGARYYHYDRHVLVTETGPYFGGTSATANVGGASGVSPRANISYKPTATSMIYAGYSEGFRLGKPQPGLPTSVCDKDADGVVDGTATSIESTRNLNSDTVRNYEVGGKFTLLNGSMLVDGDVFLMDWAGVPVRVQAPPSPLGCGLFYNANAGNARSTGVEIEAKYRISDRWHADVGGSWDHARLTQSVPALHAQAGNRLPGSPEVDGSFGLEYDFPINQHDAFARADTTYVGNIYGDLPNSQNIEVNSYLKLDFTAGIAFDHLNTYLYVNNVTNSDAYTFRGTSPAVPSFYGYELRPRTVGLRIDYRF